MDLLYYGFALLVFVATPPAHADRVKDLASVAAVRTNQLVGYGIVVGLQGTGDGADVSFTVQTVRAMLNMPPNPVSLPPIEMVIRSVSG